MTTRRRQAAQRKREKRDGTGSPLDGEPVFLMVGRLLRPHGLQGEMLMAVMTDFPERLKPDTTLFMGNRYDPITIKSVRHHNKGLIVTLEGYGERQAVEHIRNQDLFVKTENLPKLPEGEYYQHQLIGMEIVTDQGDTLGTLAEIIETGANDVYLIRPEQGKDILIPAINDVILEINLENKQMIVHLLEGLLPQ